MLLVSQHASFHVAIIFVGRMQAEFVIFGGSRKDGHPKFVASGYTDWFDDVWDTHAIASRVSHRIMITWSRASKFLQNNRHPVIKRDVLQPPIHPSCINVI